jgi:hypothetical protein
MKTLWCKNQKNPSDRLSHAWAPLSIIINFFFCVRFCRDKLLNHIERKHPGLEVPDYLLQKRESQLAAKKLAKSPDTHVTGSKY